MTTTVVRNADLLLLQRGLSALDGRPEPVVVRTAGREPETQLIVRPYTFGGRTRHSIVKWTVEVRRVFETVEAARVALVKQYAAATPDGKDGTVRVDGAHETTFTREYQEVLDQMAEFSLERISLKGLNAEVNQLPPSILAVLDPIIEDDLTE